MSLVKDALRAYNEQEQLKARKSAAGMLHEIGKTFGRQYRDQAVIEKNDVLPGEYGDRVAVIDGLRFAFKVQSCYGGTYRSLFVNFGDKWIEVSDMPGLGKVLEDRHLRPIA